MRYALLFTVFLVVVGSVLMTAESFTGFFSAPAVGGVEYGCDGCNVLLITVDTLRADHVSSYGHFQETTPNMDAVSEKGVTFTNAFSNIPHTPPSHWSIFTGLYPFVHGNYLPNDEGPELLTIPEILTKHGYVTSAFTSSHILMGFNHEFDYFNGYSDSRRNENIIRRPAGETTLAALSWLGNHSDEMFFLWVHYYDPHSPYAPPEDFDIYRYDEEPAYADESYDIVGISKKRTMREEIEKYDGEVSYTDSGIGMLFDKLSELGIKDDTLIVIVSDHGECFGEHNFSDFGYEDDRACVFHGKTLYDEEMHVPLIIFNPKSITLPMRINNVVESVDIFQTVLDILEINEHHDNNGESLVGLIEGRQHEKDYVIFHTKPRKGKMTALGIVRDGWKFISMMPSDLDLENEIAEQEGDLMVRIKSNSSGSEPYVRKMLFRRDEGEMTNFIAEETISSHLEDMLGSVISDNSITGTREIDNKTMEMLRSLGYME